MPSPRNDVHHSVPSSNDYAFFGEGAETQRDPVFVDSTGRRARVVRLVKFGVTGLCAAYTTVLGLSLVGAAAIAPSTLLPLPGVPSTSFRIEPADEPDKPQAAPLPKKAVTADEAVPAAPEPVGSWDTYPGAEPVATTTGGPALPTKSGPAPKPAPAPAPNPGPGRDPAEPNLPPQESGGGAEEPEPAETPTPEPTVTPTPEPTTEPTPTVTEPPDTDPGESGSEPSGGTGEEDGAGGETTELPILGGTLDALTTFSVPWFAVGAPIDGRAG
ncbi:hypothetical protein ABN028_28325 [Actinopolymorpha sp. B17G11]|uniref:hypothetical protein n=1 Tax=unclassified Actinopolymorpha TaxID=2627063 RepID=UPI0032D8D701